MSRSLHSTIWVTAADSERKLTSQSPSLAVEFSVQYYFKIPSVVLFFTYQKFCHVVTISIVGVSEIRFNH